MKKAAILATAAITIVFGACSDSKFKGYTKSENGLHYKFFNHDESGAKVQVGDGIIISYVISKEKNDSVIVDSKSVSSDGTGSVTFTMRKSSFAGSFEDGMMMMAKGDSAAFIVSADSFFLKTNGQNELPKGFSPGESLKGVFKIKEIRTAKEIEENQQKQKAERDALAQEMQVKEKPAFDKYLSDNKIAAKPTASGLIYVETKKGSGQNPKATDIVKVHYTGMFLDGKVFDSSVERGEPVEFPLNQVIPGWTEGLQLMKKGGKAKLVLPSAIGYGPQGNQGIPPYSPLVFEVELLDIKAAPAQSAQQMPAEPGH
ncbi:FKBP-type peptidyl-prolyl cis-trans isomerase [Aurantibacillus circumpalustris]|uniref:FKBP-type peptidyl-prolyl cis-trans isomerase n=1 Tax=Aurantibacillus circumpalustris TaxID=3036359 RepID=UPI00295ACBEB|nr:FKBP-type peptidyl-prolyl cis-trans isomerase [Aurantibacillus circumpalustris]